MEEKTKEKRTEQIAVRITSETKKILAKEAKKVDWTISKLVEKILVDWTTNNKENGGAYYFIENQIGNININGG